jgi:hypothetical protein
MDIHPDFGYSREGVYIWDVFCESCYGKSLCLFESFIIKDKTGWDWQACENCKEEVEADMAECYAEDNE